MILVIGIMSVKATKEKTERFFRLLPVKSWSIGFSRILFLHGYWLLLLLCFLCLLFIFRLNELRFEFSSYFLALSGLIFFFNVIPALQKNLTNILDSKYSRITLAAFYTIVFFAVYFSFFGIHALNRYFDLQLHPANIFSSMDISTDPLSSILVFAFSLLCSVLTIVLYQQRKFYLE